MKTFLIAVSLLFALSLKAQVNIELKEDLQSKLTVDEQKNLDQADRSLQSLDYLRALPLYDSLYKKHKDNLYLGYLFGICDIYDPHFYANPERLLKSAEPLKSKLADYYYFLGRAYADEDKYDLAIEQFQMYLKNPLNEDLRAEVNHQIEVCKNAKLLFTKAVVARITNIGKPVNTKGSEYSPVLPSDESFMVFTYRGERCKGGKQSMPGKKDEKNGVYFEDVFISYKANYGYWTDPLPIPNINTSGHDATISISHDGSKLFIYRNINAGNGDIYVSHLNGTEWTTPEKVKGINSNHWEGSVCLSPDEKTIYFSSERPGGFGGRDIYYATLLPDGAWGNVKNMGGEINTSLDEDAPFVHSDGKTLFFSSNGHNTIGGYDIFRSDLKNAKWGKPYNVGKPVNTPQDDKFYVVSSDGERGYYSSEKGSGLGQQDIYMVEPGMFGKPTALVMITGKVSFDDKPVEAEITVLPKHYKKDYSGTFTSNSASGNYLVNLPSGNDYEIVYKYKGTTMSKMVSTALVDTFARLEISAELYSEAYIEKQMAKIDSAQLMADDLSKAGYNYEQFLAKYGKTVMDSLEFKIQIGAYRFIENFNYSLLIGMPKVLRQTYEDGITRFTIGEFKRLEEADGLCRKARKKGLKDSFVIALYKGKRYYFMDLLDKKVIRD
ncbi:MAG: hypothetical protein ACJ76F_09495 [Bacteroidia bacterium]